MVLFIWWTSLSLSCLFVWSLCFCILWGPRHCWHGDPSQPSDDTAECERQFSSMNSIKTSLRNSLDQEYLCDLLLIACDGPLPKQFLPGPVIDKWLVCSNSGHHLNGCRRKFLARLWTSQKIYYWMNYELLIIIYFYCVSVWINKTTNT